MQYHEISPTRRIAYRLKIQMLLQSNKKIKIERDSPLMKHICENEKYYCRHYIGTREPTILYVPGFFSDMELSKVRKIIYYSTFFTVYKSVLLSV